MKAFRICPNIDASLFVDFVDFGVLKNFIINQANKTYKYDHSFRFVALNSFPIYSKENLNEVSFSIITYKQVKNPRPSFLF